METLAYPLEVRAKKQHSCSYCSEKINKDELYFKSTHKSDGEVYDWKSHKHCDKIASILKMFDFAEDGVTQEFFMETINDEHDDLLIKQLPQSDIQKYSDVIQQLRKVKWHEKLWYVIRYYNRPNHKE